MGHCPQCGRCIIAPSDRACRDPAQDLGNTLGRTEIAAVQLSFPARRCAVGSRPRIAVPIASDYSQIMPFALNRRPNCCVPPKLGTEAGRPAFGDSLMSSPLQLGNEKTAAPQRVGVLFAAR